eukprot:PhM_4_TR13203/c0_g1_i1/m.53079
MSSHSKSTSHTTPQYLADLASAVSHLEHAKEQRARVKHSSPSYFSLEPDLCSRLAQHPHEHAYYDDAAVAAHQNPVAVVDAMQLELRGRTAILKELVDTFQTQQQQHHRLSKQQQPLVIKPEQKDEKNISSTTKSIMPDVEERGTDISPPTVVAPSFFTDLQRLVAALDGSREGTLFEMLQHQSKNKDHDQGQGLHATHRLCRMYSERINALAQTRSPSTREAAVPPPSSQKIVQHAVATPSTTTAASLLPWDDFAATLRAIGLMQPYQDNSARTRDCEGKDAAADPTTEECAAALSAGDGGDDACHVPPRSPPHRRQRHLHEPMEATTKNGSSAAKRSKSLKHADVTSTSLECPVPFISLVDPITPDTEDSAGTAQPRQRRGTAAATPTLTPHEIHLLVEGRAQTQRRISLRAFMEPYHAHARQYVAALCSSSEEVCLEPLFLKLDKAQTTTASGHDVEEDNISTVHLATAESVLLDDRPSTAEVRVPSSRPTASSSSYLAELVQVMRHKISSTRRIQISKITEFLASELKSEPHRHRTTATSVLRKLAMASKRNTVGTSSSSVPEDTTLNIRRVAVGMLHHAHHTNTRERGDGDGDDDDGAHQLDVECREKDVLLCRRHHVSDTTKS